jgi:urea transport system permease protein
VAAGGVGNLWGVVCAGLGLGILNKVLEPWTQAVFAKVIVLVGIILFLQARPQGLFPPKGRLSDG